MKDNLKTLNRITELEELVVALQAQTADFETRIDDLENPE